MFQEEGPDRVARGSGAEGVVEISAKEDSPHARAQGPAGERLLTHDFTPKPH
jgi:hypothetical protein